LQLLLSCSWFVGAFAFFFAMSKLSESPERAEERGGLGWFSAP